MIKSSGKGPWYLFTGLIIGVLLGLLCGWYISPVKYADVRPAMLHPSQKEQYFVLIAKAYTADNDIGRAKARISTFVNPIDLNSLRAMLQSLEMSPNPIVAESYNDVRILINNLDQYLRTNPEINLNTPTSFENQPQAEEFLNRTQTSAPSASHESTDIINFSSPSDDFDWTNSE